MTTEATPLTGTDKQIAFANELRETFLLCWIGEEDKIVNKFGDRGEPGVGKEIVSKVGAEAQAIFDAMIAETSAKTWIEIMWNGRSKCVKASEWYGERKKSVISVLRAYKAIQVGKN